MPHEKTTKYVGLTAADVRNAISDWLSERPPFTDGFEPKEVHFANNDDNLPDGFIFAEQVVESK